MYYKYAIVLLNLFGQQQAVLPDLYDNLAKCNVARTMQGYANINIFGVHGECKLVKATPPVAAPSVK
jgi:hypothetical protein